MKRGVTAPPTPTPQRKRALPIPRWPGPVQLATILLELGKAAASPTPIRKRAIANDHTRPNHLTKGSRGAIAVAAVNTEHQRIAAVNTPRGPKRSPIQPPGTWNRA